MTNEEEGMAAINEPAEDNAIVPHNPSSSASNNIDDVMSMSSSQGGVEKITDHDDVDNNNNNPPSTSLDEMTTTTTTTTEVIPSPKKKKKKKKKRMIIDDENDELSFGDDSTTVAVAMELTMAEADHGNGNNDDGVTEEIIHETKRAKLINDDDIMKKMGKDLDDKLDYLHECISVAILAQRKEDEHATVNNKEQGEDIHEKKCIDGSNSSAYAKLRDAATQAYTSLAEYGSSMDLSSNEKEQAEKNAKNDVVVMVSSLFLSESRRKKLLDVGRSLWMTIRNNPELFNDSSMIPEVDESTVVAGRSLLFKDRQNKAVASGYARAIAARLIFVDYINTRCSVGIPPKLQETIDRMEGADNTYRSTPSLQELVFGLKTFSRSGLAILKHDRKCAAYDLLSLASSCFEYISSMAESGNTEAAVGLKDSLDECFDALSMLPNAASLFGESRIENTTHDFQQDAIVKPWQTLVLNALEGAKSFIDRHCRSDMISVHRQRFLPTVARLCCKHGAFFVKLCQYENAEKALSIALNSTNDCLNEIRQELENDNNDNNRKLKGGRQALHNLEAELVVLSIEAFYLLSVTYQSSSKKEKAIICLDRIQSYMEEQHARDNELHSQVMTTLGSGKDFVFSERGSISSINHFEKDASDIKTRSIIALDDARSRHDAEKATLAFSRIMIFHKAIPNPSQEEESLIDKHIRDLVDLSLCVSSSSTSSSKTKGHGDIFDMALRAIRQVHVRRAVSEMSGAVSNSVTYTDNYSLFLDNSIKMHSIRRPFIMLDKLNAMLGMLATLYKVRDRKFATKSISRLDSEALLIAKEFIDMVTTFVGNGNSDTTLFVTSNQSLSNELFEESKIHFSRAVSLYHSLNAHHECAQWSDLLIHFLNLKQTTILSLEDSDVLLGQVMAVNAYAQSMSGNHAEGMKTARDAWAKVKSVDCLVTLFHCSLRHEMKNHSVDTLLELDFALKELLSVDEALLAFPRLTNSCVENEVGEGDMVLLGLQERWMDTLLGSFCQQSKEKDLAELEAPEFSLFTILRAYLKHFEHIITSKYKCATINNFEALGRIVDGVMKVLVQMREPKEHMKRGGGIDSVNDGARAGLVLVWDDVVTSKLVGNQSDCVWAAEELWNIGNQLMAVSVGSPGSFDSRLLAADVFAASHDFSLMSEEEEGKLISKGYLDYDVKFDPTKAVVPNFHQAEDSLSCDISSEFSGHCLLVSVATAVDYASDCLFKSGGDITPLNNDVQILLSRSLHRLAMAKDELQLNCSDEKQRYEIDKLIVLLTLRCLLGVGDDSLAYECLNSNGLISALGKNYLNEMSMLTMCSEGDSQSLRNVALMSSLAEEKKMRQTSRSLNCLCAQLLSSTLSFAADIGDCKIFLGDIQKKTIQSSTCAKDCLDVYSQIDQLVKNHKNAGTERKDGSFYSTMDLDWFAKDSNNRAVEYELLGDNQAAATLFAVALNLLPLCGKEMQQYKNPMNAAYQQITAKMSGDSLIWSLLESH